MISSSQISIASFNNLSLGYVAGTYPPSIHTCNSCRRYVVVTYRPIIFISCTKHVSDTCNSGELILLGRNRYGANEYSLTFILIPGAILYN